MDFCFTDHRLIQPDSTTFQIKCVIPECMSFFENYGKQRAHFKEAHQDYVVPEYFQNFSSRNNRPPEEHRYRVYGVDDALTKLLKCLESDMVVVEEEHQVKPAIKQIKQRHTIAVDCEGVGMDRRGKLCVVSVATTDARYVFDIVKLGEAAFSLGLRRLLESPKIVKLFFDCRRDSEALFHQYQVRLQNVLDCQMLELAWRHQHDVSTRFLSGLSTCLERYLPQLCLAFDFSGIKQATVARFAPEKGGDFALWEKRPMDLDMLRYATFDVLFLRVLAATLQVGMEGKWNNRAWEYSSINVGILRDTPEYVDGGKQNAIAPTDF
eukprot:TRINITY_DN5726_c0_g1_i2.p1 TRINITY_DN5726_c0_g1~~TRINITY_DN5726_c0_g1_i2.p1  ORF type:complete len:323 (+),score=68.38 TRINITY_DN5726_c0_g1_i2:120-1088(+)